MDIRDNSKVGAGVDREKLEINPERANKTANIKEIIEEVPVLVNEVKQKGDELLKKIQDRKPQPEIIEDFKSKEHGIENEAQNAADLIINNNDMESNRNLNEVFSEDLNIRKMREIIEEVKN